MWPCHLCEKVQSVPCPPAVNQVTIPDIMAVACDVTGS